MSGATSSPSGLTRRSFLKATGLVAGGAAAATAIPTLHAMAENGQGGGSSDAETKTYITACMRSGCMQCQHKVDVREGNVVNAYPWDDEARGYRPCLRGLSEIQRLYSPERPHYPLKRVGERGSGNWERISWDEAIETITGKYKEVIESHGPQSNLFISGSGNAGAVNTGMQGRFYNTIGGTKIDQCVDMAKNVGIQRLYGGAGYEMPGSLEDDGDMMNADTLLVWGSNFSESYVQRWRDLVNAKQRGVKVIVIDPNLTTVAAKADEWIPVQMGADPALMLAMVNTIVDENLHDVDYLMNHSVAPYLVREDTKEFLRMSDLGVPPTQGPHDATGKPTVIDKPVVWDLDAGAPVADGQAINPAMTGTFDARGFKTRTAWDCYREGIKEYTPEAASQLCDVDPETIKRLARIAAAGNVIHLCGLGSQALNNGVHIGTGLSSLVAVTGMIERPGTGVLGFSLPTPFNRELAAPGKKMAQSIPYLRLFDIMQSGEYKGAPLVPKTITVTGSGFLGGLPDPNKLKKEVIDKIELFVVIDVAMTDGARYADIVLPAGHYYEDEDIIVGGLSHVLLYCDRAIDPLFECKPDAEIFTLMGKAMGYEKYFDKPFEDYLELVCSLPEYQKAGITLAKLRKEHWGRWEDKGVRNNAGYRYTTSTGKVEIYSEKPKVRMDYGQTFDVDAERIPRWFAPTEAWAESEAMKKYPLAFTSVRARNRWHTQGFEKPWLLEIMPEPIIYMNPVDATQRNLSSSDYVEIFNDRGHAVSKLIVNPGVRPGMLVYPKGWQAHQFKAGSFSELLTSEFDPVAVNSSFFDNAVEVRAWNKEG